jgi:hypothetical protein
LRRSDEEASSSKGSYKHPFRKYFPPNQLNPTPKGLNFESLQYTLHTILEAHDKLVPPENSEDVVEEEESSPNVFEHFSDSIFQANFETVHPYNTKCKAQSKPSSETSTNVPPKQLKQDETKHNLAALVLEYDLIEDLNKLRNNISIYELLKFPLLLQKMLQNIAENSKNNKKIAEIGSKTTQKIPAKTTPKPLDKRDLTEKTISNVDKAISGTSAKNQQNSVVNTRKNVPPFLLNFENFNRNVHNCMVDSGASSNVMPLSIFQKINAEVQPSNLKIIQLN